EVLEYGHPILTQERSDALLELGTGAREVAPALVDRGKAVGHRYRQNGVERQNAHISCQRSVTSSSRTRFSRSASLFGAQARDWLYRLDAMTPHEHREEIPGMVAERGNSLFRRIRVATGQDRRHRIDGRRRRGVSVSKPGGVLGQACETRK